MTDDRFEAMRKAMVVSQLRPSDVNSPHILNVMGSVAREDFVAEGQRTTAYSDRGCDLGDGRRLNPPHTTGLMLEAAKLDGENKVLLIGAGSGYVAALLNELTDTVTALEANETLADAARTNLADCNNVEIVAGPLADGWKASAPYDLILIDGAVEVIPDALIEQLADEGQIVTGYLENKVTKLSAAYKVGEHLSLHHIADCACAQLPEFSRPQEFVF